MKRGFTLVELSIVLVIIGLLIGGILVAQSMISTSKVTAGVAQIQQFDAGVMSFKAKFNYLPGDAPGFGGNGNGLIACETPNYTHAFNCELAAFWHNMDSQEFPEPPRSYVTSGEGVIANISGANKNVPESKIGKSGSYWVGVAAAAAGNAQEADTDNPRNYYTLIDPSQNKTDPLAGGCQFVYTEAGAGAAPSPATASETLALDVKMDDGIADTGNVRSGVVRNRGDGVGGMYDASPRAGCSVGAAYTVDNPDYECTPVIRIGAGAGTPQ